MQGGVNEFRAGVRFREEHRTSPWDENIIYLTFAVAAFSMSQIYDI